MRSDWYKTNRVGTYLVVRAGVDLTTLQLPIDIRRLLEGVERVPFEEDVESNTKERQFNLLGIEDCLRFSGHCLVRTPRSN